MNKNHNKVTTKPHPQKDMIIEIEIANNTENFHHTIAVFSWNFIIFACYLNKFKQNGKFKSVKSSSC